uniref:Uncharacterized protein n=1 Tax=Candidatus Kentrum sp. FW TaxID=2126338 RepID=A0A450RT62_9GAMM|nr:MAG: hypothetical protein BECKFW1821A_GA0114235_100138 [Candidatus Kentron sp. FW]VFJ73124.1 MAG: hypothetical protein BECKFW1821C_GA0114237_10452 [Candidatus Kentron sp. FW]
MIEKKREREKERYISQAMGYNGKRDERLEISRMVGKIIRETGKKNAEIANEMSALSGHRFTVQTLSGWRSLSKERFNIPLYAVPILEVVCGTRQITEWLVTKHGGAVLFGEEKLLIQLGREEWNRYQTANRIDALKQRMREYGSLA